MKTTAIISALILLMMPLALATVSHTTTQVTPGGFQSGTYWFPGTLGVGTDSPQSPLHITGDVRWTGSLLQGSVPYARLTGVPSANTSQAGIVQLTDSISSTSTTTAATPKNVKQAYDLAASKGTGTVTSVGTGTGLTGGPITTTGTISLATSGVTAGTYTKLTIDAYGRATSGAALMLITL